MHCISYLHNRTKKVAGGGVRQGLDNVQVLYIYGLKVKKSRVSDVICNLCVISKVVMSVWQENVTN